MLLRPYISSFTNNSIKLIASKFGLKTLPIFFHGDVYKIPIAIWNSPRIKYEPYMANLLKNNLRPGDTFFDIGAHFGLWSLFSSRLVGESGKVLAFEPSPAYQVTTQTLQSSNNCLLFNIGLSDRNEHITFYAQGYSSSGSFVKQVTEINTHYMPNTPISEIFIEAKTLDYICDECKLMPNVIKIDVEGHEFKVLNGASDTLTSIFPKLVIEIHPPQLRLADSSDDDVKKFLNSIGYEFDVVDRKTNSIYTIFAYKN